MRKILIALAGLAICASLSAQTGPKYGKNGGIGSSSSTYQDGEPTGGTYAINGTTGIGTFQATVFGSATLKPTPQPLNSSLRIVTANDQYHDNMIDMQSLSVGTGSSGPNGQCGNAALRFLDMTGLERAAAGWAPVINSQYSGSTCTSAFEGGNTYYIELSQLNGANNASANGNFAVKYTNDASAPTFPGYAWRPFHVVGATNHVFMEDHTGRVSIEIDLEDNYFTLYGTTGAPRIQLHATTTSAPVQMLAGNGGGTLQAIRIDDSLGAGTFLGSNGNYGLGVVNPVDAVNWLKIQGGTAGNGAVVGIEGSDTNVDLVLTGKGNGAVQSLSVIRPALTTVSGLATLDPSPRTGDLAAVTDASVCSANATVVAGGAIQCAVIFSGSSWKAIVTP